MGTVRFIDPAEDDDNIEDYTVPIPEGLTEEFHPSHPVTTREIIDWEVRNIEPYPGYAEEVNNWEKAWEEVNRAQQAADGGYMPIIDPVHIKSDDDDDDDNTEGVAATVASTEDSDFSGYHVLRAAAGFDESDDSDRFH